MAAPGKWDFTIIQGSSFNRTLVIRNGIDAPVDLTGYEARMKAKELVSDTTELFEWLSTGVSPEITITPGTGIIAITVAPAATALMDFDTGVHDLELYTAGDADVVRVLEGNVALSKGVTD